MRKVFLWVTGCGVYATFMIGYLLLLTLFLPSTFTYQLNWIKVGSYAEYSVERYVPVGFLVQSGTYSWRVISIHTNPNGELMARINETGTISEINVKEESLKWFSRYYNDYLMDLSDFKIGNEIYEGVGLGEVSVQDEVHLCVGLTQQIPAFYRVSTYWFDRETGLLLSYRFDFRGEMTLKHLRSTNISGEAPNGKAIIDLILISPFFIVPVVGATKGLLLIKLRRYTFSRRFWFFFILFNGMILASVANFPFRFPLGRLLTLSRYSIIYVLYPIYSMSAMGNFFFWIGGLAAAIILIDRLAFPMILHSKQ